jgi:glycosyltransferase involved in cell wall biosynthesis
MPRATVIIPTRNRAPVLRQCLHSLEQQTLGANSFEVIVVDNGSNDDTAEVARSFGARMDLTVLCEAEPGLHVGRHAGWRAARSEQLVFVDDDIQAEPGWLAAVVEAFEDPQVALVGGNNLPAFSHQPPAWLQRWWERPVLRGRALGFLSILDFGEGCFEIDPEFVWGCNFSVRASVLEAAGGFHPDGVPREHLRLRGDGETYVSTVVRREGWRAWFDGRATVHHLVDARRMTPAYFEERAFAQGISDSYTAIRAAGRVEPDRHGLRQRLHRALAPARDWWASGGWRGEPASAELRAVQARVRAGYRRGWDFHRTEVDRDPALLDWVLKDNYL